jgi:hypothetical protein
VNPRYLFSSILAAALTLDVPRIAERSPIAAGISDRMPLSLSA